MSMSSPQSFPAKSTKLSFNKFPKNPFILLRFLDLSAFFFHSVEISIPPIHIPFYFVYFDFPHDKLLWISGKVDCSFWKYRTHTESGQERGQMRVKKHRLLAKSKCEIQTKSAFKSLEFVQGKFRYENIHSYHTHTSTWYCRGLYYRLLVPCLFSIILFY